MLTAQRLCPSPRSGRGSSPCHDHGSRSQTVGRRCTVEAADPRLQTVIWMRISSGEALAYSTKTSKYLLSLNTPVSSSSYSYSDRPRRRLVLTRSAYG